MARKRRRGDSAEPRGFDPQATFKAAGEAFDAGELPRAAALLQKVLDRHPGSVVCWNNLGFIRHLQGRTSAALDCYQRALGIDPRHAGARFNLAKGLAALQRTDEAAAQLQTLLAQAPDHAEALNELGNLRHASGRVRDAERLYREALARDPHYPHALRNLGELLRAAGEFEEAAQTLRRYLDREPRDAFAWLSLGEALLGSKAAGDAASVFQRAAELADDETELWVRLGQAWSRTGNWRGALHAYRRAQRTAPQDTAVLSGLAKSYLDAGELQAAEQTLIAAIGDDNPAPRRAELLNLLGVVRLNAQNVQGALQAFGESLEAVAHNAVAQSNLGLALAAQGQRDGAQAAWRKAIELDADFGEAYRHLAHSQRCTSLQDDLPAMITAALERDIPELSRMHLHFAMGKQCDDCGEYERAFAHYARGNAIHFRRAPFDLDAWQRHVERICRVFDRAYFARMGATGDPSPQPVFVVGMPRSGTTLIEQVIARHSQGAGRSELRKIEQLVFRLESDGRAYPECVPELRDAQLAAMARDYLAELRAGSAAAANRIVDKMPFNFLHLGLITTLFANARVVHCQRDPLDTCLSNYFQFFPPGAGYAYDLATLGAYYRTYERLMAHWYDVLPRAPLSVQYESFVQDPQTQSRALLDYLDLPWERDCLAFHDPPREVLTLSAWQVREPLYATSVERWRHYAAHLEPLREALAG